MCERITEFVTKKFSDVDEDFQPYLVQVINDMDSSKVDSIRELLCPYLESYGVDTESEEFTNTLNELSELLCEIKPHLRKVKEKKPKVIHGFSVEKAAEVVEKKINMQKLILKDVEVNINSDIDEEGNLQSAKLRAERTQRRLERRKTKTPSASPLEEEPAAPVLSIDMTAQGTSKNIDIQHIQIGVAHKVLIEDGELHLTHNHKYGLIGRNGVGKSTLLRNIAKRLIPEFPSHISIMYVEQEIEGSEKTCLDYVMNSDSIFVSISKEKEELQKKANEEKATMKELERLQVVTNEFKFRDYDHAKERCITILKGLGFTDDYISKRTMDLSGGWRMRVALAAALFSHPDLLLLDEPTNHLDLPTVTWLQDFLVEYEGTCIFVSHDRYFLNYIVTDIILLRNKRLLYYKGTYDNYEKTELELMKNKQRLIKNIEEKQEHIMKFVNRFRYNANRADLAQSRLKEVHRLEEDKQALIHDGYGEEEEQKLCVFKFTEPQTLQFPILQIVDVAFGYTPDNILFRDINFGIDLQSRIGILGRNGVGKSTLIKIIMGELFPSEGQINRNPKLRIAYFAQHHVDQLDLTSTPLLSIQKVIPTLTEQEARSGLARFGITEEMASRPNKTLSGGQRTRLTFALLSIKKPDIYILDEPTNHLDIETITVLADALNEFKGGVVCVSHDQFFVSKVCKELWTIQNHSIIRFNGEFKDYKRVVLKGQI